MSKALVNAAAVFVVLAWFYMAFLNVETPRHPLSRTEVTTLSSDVAEEAAPKEPAVEDIPPDPAFIDDEPMTASEELLSSIKDYVDTPKGAVDWKLFGQTKQRAYSYEDKDGRQWTGVQPEFPDKLKKLDRQKIVVKGYMFPLGQEEKQPHFLLGPFPVSCPFHYDVTPSLLVEVHADRPVAFSYEAVKIRGQLELVPDDDEYNVFYRLKKAKVIR